MKNNVRVTLRRLRERLSISALVLATIFSASVPAHASTPRPDSTILPSTAVGKLGGELVHHINTDTADQIRQWSSTTLSSAIGTDDKADFAKGLDSAASDSGGVDIFDVRPIPGRPDTLQMVVKGRSNGKLGLFILTADPAHPDQLAQADLVPMNDPSLYAGWPKSAVSQAEMKRLIHGTLDRLVRTNDFSGCVTVADGGKTVFDECRGLAERNFGVPVDHQTKFRIASIGKMFTAVAIAQLVEAGKLSWDAALAELVPEYHDEAAKKITVWQLLHHTSGLGDVLVPEYFADREKFINPADYLELIAHQPKLSEPGKDWNYSNAGYVLLGRIIENVSHEEYFAYIEQHVFAAAGMQSSGFNSLEDVTPKLAVGYFHDGMFAREWKADWMKLAFKGGPDGGAYSTNTDLLRFAQALRAGKLVKSATLAKMFDDEVPAGPGGYAAGFGDRLSHGRNIRGHSGGIEGTDANVQMVWGTDAAVALTSNQGPGQSWLLAEHIADLLAAGHAIP